MGALSIIVLFLLVGNSFEQWYGFGGYGGYISVPTLPITPNQCLSGNTGTWCKAYGSSEYPGFLYGFYSSYAATFAVDGAVSPWNGAFFHSNYDTYPWLRVIFYTAAAMTTPADSAAAINGVVVVQRCDANSLYHFTRITAREATPVNTIGAISGAGQILTGGTYCGAWQGQMFTGCTSFTIACATAAVQQEFTIQKETLHVHGGGWPGFAGGQWNSWTGNAPAQNAAVPASFLMVNEIYFY